ncbi:JAB domain-containing protein [Mailhella massiliensis]|uniref:JAB domain-containing protein n=1 Tax=Mailhella massiliensis TaxID=1903261 RepID=UPI00097D3648|nr:DNA repair protein RadC [Mailhella massiliensis]
MKKDDSLSESALRSGHRKRLRERFLAEPSALPDYELLELALGCVYLRRDNKILAKRLLQRFDGFGALLRASADELAQVEGCGPAVDSFLAVLREIIARASQSNVQRKRPVTLPDLVEMGRLRLGHCVVEEVWIALLDKQNRLLMFKKIRHGSLNHVALEPLEVVELMVRHHASSIVLMHNHPGGAYMPSQEDKALTGRIALALRHLGLLLHDHVIITSEASYSMMQDRRIEVPKR